MMISPNAEWNIVEKGIALPPSGRESLAEKGVGKGEFEKPLAVAQITNQTISPSSSNVATMEMTESFEVVCNRRGRLTLDCLVHAQVELTVLYRRKCRILVDELVSLTDVSEMSDCASEQQSCSQSESISPRMSSPTRSSRGSRLASFDMALCGAE